MTRWYHGEHPLVDVILVVLFIVAWYALLICTQACAQSPTSTARAVLRWQQPDDGPHITSWMLWLDGHQLLEIPRAEATPEATPGQYVWPLPWWINPSQPQVYLAACDASVGPPSCSDKSNEWPTRTPTFTATPTAPPAPTPTPTLRPTPQRPFVVCLGTDCVTVGQ